MSNFVAHLRSLNAAALAELRRSLSFPLGEYPPVFRYVETLAHRQSKTEWDRKAHYLVAGLFALKERAEEKSITLESQDSGITGDAKTASGFSLGRSISMLKAPGESEVSPSTEARFRNLLGCDTDELQHPLRQMVALLAAQDIRVDWGQLLEDLRYWSSAKKGVQRKWGQHFYAPISDNSNEQSA